MTSKLLSLLLLTSSAAPAVELHLQFGALERILSEQMFTDEGRKYVRGSVRDKCSFAYLEHPHIQGEAGRLKIHAKFTGRSGMNLLGQCVGLGDAFDLTIDATPLYRDGNIGLKEVRVTSDSRTGFYIRRVCSSLATSLAHDFKYPLGSEAKKALEDPGTQPNYKREMKQFTVPEIHVTDDALVLVVDFQLIVK